MCVLNCFPGLELGLFSEEVCLISRQGCAERGRGNVAAASQKRRPSTVAGLLFGVEAFLLLLLRHYPSSPFYTWLPLPGGRLRNPGEKREGGRERGP